MLLQRGEDQPVPGEALILPPATEFDAYLMVDWSARSVPARGADSIWLCMLIRQQGTLVIRALENPSTRHEAVERIGRLLAAAAADRLAVLIGFDFPYGYPSAFPASIGLAQMPPWRAVWDELRRRVVDGHDNRNNRFEVAAALNQTICGQPFPFWGCPEAHQSPYLSPRKLYRYDVSNLREYRITDKQVVGPQPVWKLAGVGSVGSQALMGIPYVARLRDDRRLAAVSSVWPFETRLGRLPPREHRSWLILHAEIYPSLILAQPGPGEVKDAAQVRALAKYFAAADEQGRLAELFLGNPALTASERERVESEEGWILGVTGVGEPLDLPFDVPAERVQGGYVAPPVNRARARPLQTDTLRGGTSSKGTTAPGHVNRNDQVVIRPTGLQGTDHLQHVYVLRCRHCGHEYGANGSDIFQRRCPRCQGGRPGLPY